MYPFEAPLGNMSCFRGAALYASFIERSTLGVLNNKDFQGQICPGLDHSSKPPGRFKKVRPARPQPLVRAERTRST